MPLGTEHSVLAFGGPIAAFGDVKTGPEAHPPDGYVLACVGRHPGGRRIAVIVAYFGHPIVNGQKTSILTRLNAFLAQVRCLKSAAPTGYESSLCATVSLRVTVKTCYNSIQYTWALGSDHVDVPRHPRREGKRTTQVV